MASGHSDYVRGTMPIDGHGKTFDGFIKGSAFITAFLIVVLLMPILLFAVHLAWLPSLIVTFVVGLILAPLLKLGGAWYGVLVGMAAVTSLLCLAIAVF